MLGLRMSLYAYTPLRRDLEEASGFLALWKRDAVDVSGYFSLLKRASEDVSGYLAELTEACRTASLAGSPEAPFGRLVCLFMSLIFLFFSFIEAIGLTLITKPNDVK